MKTTLICLFVLLTACSGGTQAASPSTSTSSGAMVDPDGGTMMASSGGSSGSSNGSSGMMVDAGCSGPAFCGAPTVCDACLTADAGCSCSPVASAYCEVADCVPRTLNNIDFHLDMQTKRLAATHSLRMTFIVATSSAVCDGGACAEMHCPDVSAADMDSSSMNISQSTVVNVDTNNGVDTGFSFAFPAFTTQAKQLFLIESRSEDFGLGTSTAYDCREFDSTTFIPGMSTVRLYAELQ